MQYDVAVIGLGAMGAMAAWSAASRGASVVGFEQYGIAHDRGSSHGGSRIFRRTMFEGELYNPIVARAAELWRTLEKESCTRLLRTSGGLCVGPRDGELIVDALRCAAAGGVEHELLEPDELAARFPQHAHIPGADRAAYRPDRFPVFIRDSGPVDGWGIPDVDGRGVKLGAGPTAPKPWIDHPRDNDPPVDEKDVEPVAVFCRAAFPGLTPTPVDARACMNTKTPDGDFVLGIPEAAPRLVLACGFSGHGFKHAGAVGEIVADLALTGASSIPLERFSPDRFRS